MLTPGHNDPTKDLHMTPPCIAKALIAKLPLSGKVLEPAMGEGAFYNSFPEHLEKDWCEIEKGRDFFNYHENVDWVVTNPPFSQFVEFLRHSVAIADNIAFYCTINHAIALRMRNRLMRQVGFGIVSITTTDTPPKPWPQSGFQVGLVYWKRGYTGSTVISHLEHKFTA